MTKTQENIMVEDAHAQQIKEACTAVKINGWHLEGMGGQLVLEGLQRCLAYCSRRGSLQSEEQVVSSTIVNGFKNIIDQHFQDRQEMGFL